MSRSRSSYRLYPIPSEKAQDSCGFSHEKVSRGGGCAGGRNTGSIPVVSPPTHSTWQVGEEEFYEGRRKVFLTDEAVGRAREQSRVRLQSACPDIAMRSLRCGCGVDIPLLTLTQCAAPAWARFDGRPLLAGESFDLVYSGPCCSTWRSPQRAWAALCRSRSGRHLVVQVVGTGRCGSASASTALRRMWRSGRVLPPRRLPMTIVPGNDRRACAARRWRSCASTSAATTSA